MERRDMLKTFLVEDEVIVRETIKRMIPWEQYGFELAGADHVFHPATARIDDKDCKVIHVRSDEVKTPVMVRYCMKNWFVPTLFNCFGIPASPFRSDDQE